MRFDLEILGRDDGRRCYRCHTPYRPMFVVRPPASPVGRYACIAHAGAVADGWDRVELGPGGMRSGGMR